ncbi:MAG: ABC transporter ATP-binding protein [Gordonia sp. (in: high G+C Gram-positive bacteria)]
MTVRESVVEVVTLEGVHKQFGGTPVLHGVDLALHDGEFLSVTGRSGSGKSTLLRLIIGLDAPTSGTVRTHGRVAVGFQEPRLLPWLTVARNVGFGLPRGSEADVAAALREVQLDHKADAWPVSLSGGQAQRVSLARAIVHRPRLLILDEPFGALDALTRLEMRGLVARLRAEYGWSIVMVTHDVSEAVALSDRVVVLREGRIGFDTHIHRSDGDVIDRDSQERVLLRELGVAL